MRRESPRLQSWVGVTDEHPDHGEFAVTFRVHSEASRFVVEPGTSSFETTNRTSRMECVELAADRIHEEFGDEVRVAVDEDDL